MASSMEANGGSSPAIIAIMGCTGSGKSTFIQTATGSEDVVVGHKLESCTQEPQLHSFLLDGREVALLDTPGFDDSYKTDAEVLQDIATFLAGTYRKGIRLSGIIYLQRITDPRLNHGGRANLDLFRGLCGDDPLHKLVLGTTFWGTMKDTAMAEAHERELKEVPEYWGDMLAKGARIERFGDSRESAWSLIRGLLAVEKRITLRLQRELVDEKLELAETTAGDILHRELAKMAKRYEDRVEKLRGEMETLDHELKAAKKVGAERADRERRAFQRQIDVLRAGNREDVRQREMEYDAQLLALQRERDTEASQSAEALSHPPQTPEGRAGSPDSKIKGAGSPGSKTKEPTSEEQQLAKAAKREKYIQIATAVGETATAAGLSVINPLAIPVAFGGLVKLLNACFASKNPARQPLLEPDKAQELASQG